MTKSEKLQRIQEIKNPLLNKITVMKGDQGEQGPQGPAGYSPVKGKDYYTEAEINFIISYIQSRVKDGAPGTNGKDGTPGKNGQTPIRGVDFWTPADQEKILQSVLGLIPKPKDGVSPKTEDVVNQVVDILKKKPIEFKDIKGTEKLIEFLKTGGFRGGGISALTIDNTPIIGGIEDAILFQKNNKVSQDAGFEYTTDSLNVRAGYDPQDLINPIVDGFRISAKNADGITVGRIVSQHTDNTTDYSGWTCYGLDDIGSLGAQVPILYLSGYGNVGVEQFLYVGGSNIGANAADNIFRWPVRIGEWDTTTGYNISELYVRNAGNKFEGGTPPFIVYFADSISQPKFVVEDATGFVGIGTDSPTTSNGGVLGLAEIYAPAGNSVLHLHTEDTAYHQGGLLEVTTGSGRIGQWNVYNDNGDSDGQGRMDFEVGTLDGLLAVLQLWSNKGTSFGSYADDTTRPPDDGMMIPGFAGFGTMSPQTQVDINGILRVQGNGSNPSTGAGFEMRYEASNNYSSFVSYDRDNSLYKGFVLDASYEAFYNSGTEAVRFTGGLVGIKTTAPTHSLTIGSTGTGIATYNTVDQVTNYERGIMSWSGNILSIGTDRGGTGSYRTLRLRGVNAQLDLKDTSAGGTTLMSFSASGNASTASTNSIDFAGATLTMTSGTNAFMALRPTYNQASGSAANTDFLINRTKTAVGSGAQLFVDYQVATVSKFAMLDTGIISKYAGVTTSGWGVPAIYSSGRATAQNAANTSVATYTCGAADGSFEVSANVLVTTATVHNFTVTVDYTDEGNTARTVTLPFAVLAGTFVTAITNAGGAVPYEGIPIHIRCKASTAITVKTVGTFTTVVYNVESSIKQIA